MTQTTWSQRLRRTIAAGAAVVLGAGLLAGPAAADEETRTVDGGSADWGVKQSFRNYVTGPIGHGAITVTAPATTNDDGTFNFANATGEVTGDSASLAFEGAVKFFAHGGVLETTISDVRVEIDGTTGNIIADIEAREFVGTSGDLGDMQSHQDVKIASLDLSNAPLIVTEETASVTGAPAALTEEAAPVFALYEAGTEFDPISFSVTLEPVEDPVVWEPAIEVFAADGVTPLGNTEVAWGDTIVVKGTGFDPAGNVGGRGVPIPADLPQGTYVVFGKFLDDWKPSEGAATSARPVGSQKWALAEDVLDQVPAQYQGAIRAQWVNINEAGEFTAELVVAEGDKFTDEGNFGVYTYPAGGSGNPAQEQYAPVNVKENVTPEPTETPSTEPTETPSPEPTETPSPEPTETPTQPTTPEPTQSASPEPTAPATPQPSEPATPQPTQPSGNGDKPGALPSTGGEDAGVFAAGAVLLISGALIAARAGARKKV